MSTAENYPGPSLSAGAVRFPCAQCGGRLEFAPGTTRLKCPYCGHENPVPRTAATGETASSDSPDGESAPTPAPEIDELDLHEHLASLAGEADTVEALTVKCDACAATVTKPPNVTSWRCPFCGTPIVSTAASKKVIKPAAVLPFVVTRDRAVQSFKTWLASRWFAPNKLHRYGEIDAAITGMYIPAWTYDCRTEADYQGQRGQHYYENQTFTSMVNGKATTQTRRVRKTRWYPAAGHVTNRFDDLLVLASDSLPEDRMQELEPWDLKALLPYEHGYLSGFVAESYKVGLEDGFGTAKVLMRPSIESTIRGNIGGDEQRITRYHVDYHEVTFKHILLPVWMSSYRYNNKVYRFLVNARTGEVSGDRPYSGWKITFAVLIGLAVVGIIVAVIAATR